MQSTPDQLVNEQQHYKELFQKLKVSYIEEETRERYLRMLAEDDVSADTAARTQLEQHNAEAKATLQQQKAAVQACQAQITALSQSVPAQKRRVDGALEGMRTLETESASLRASLHELEQLRQQRPQPVMSLKALQSKQQTLGVSLSQAQADTNMRKARVEALVLQKQTLQAQAARMAETHATLTEQAARGPAAGVQHEIGQMLVSLTQIARQIEA
ncbi:hypothetical protein BCR37DRAFT_395738 [Protomyces lactucae-debilis]|uniref:Kinetochore protein Sos7 coiled-coil domain-containing protein n=1 Tax=Protomyces lactucae-debilis TaxID=2754530 RepID=A0A1Y2ESR8_PROLT|nr:uncharacterized protein BCR37DRAFT_395738 [Protomyces lactucae-debilis]ORY74582.1 hypothetical protein BCR37DRAFT_395738 [Protomyces lactucae-debilis]